MLSDALWAEGTETEKAVRELDERIERASRGLASLGSPRKKVAGASGEAKLGGRGRRRERVE